MAALISPPSTHKGVTAMDDKTKSILEVAKPFAEAALKPINLEEAPTGLATWEKRHYAAHKAYRLAQGHTAEDDAIREGYLCAKYKSQGYDALLLIGEGGYGGPYNFPTYWRAVKGSPQEIASYYHVNSAQTDTDESDNTCYAVIRIIDLHMPPGSDTISPALRTEIESSRFDQDHHRRPQPRSAWCTIDEMDKDGIVPPPRAQEATASLDARPA
jgi:hypothetical protein